MFIDYETPDGKVHSAKVDLLMGFTIPKGTRILRFYEQVKVEDNVFTLDLNEMMCKKGK